LLDDSVEIRFDQIGSPAACLAAYSPSVVSPAKQPRQHSFDGAELSSDLIEILRCRLNCTIGRLMAR